MNPTHDETWRARVHLAAANRLAVYDDLEEGIDNHFTMRVPGQDDRYLVLPFGQVPLPSGFGAPYELRDLRLQDQSRMAPIESRALALRF